MLPLNVVSDLDRLASEGVIDFDAAALLTGAQPRYVGNPHIPMLPPTEVPLNSGQFNQPASDSFIDPKTGLPKTQIEKSGNPAWKKILFAGLVIAAGAFGISKLKGVKQFFKNKNFSIKDKIKIPQGIKDGWTKFTNKCSQGLQWFKGIFSKGKKV